MNDIYTPVSVYAAKDAVTGAMESIDSDHGNIHKRLGFTLNDELSVASAQVGGVQITPQAAVNATLAVNMTNANADLTYTAVDPGVQGNDITVAHVDPEAAGAALSVVASPNAIGAEKVITVNLATSAAVKATKQLGGITYTAKTAGVDGNSITVAHVTAGNNTPLSIVVTDTAIVVNLATGGTGTATSKVSHILDLLRDGAPAASALVSGVPTTAYTATATAVAATPLAGGSAGGVITSTAAQVKAAVNAHPYASTLVSVEDESTGTGIVNATAATALAGGLDDVYLHLKAIQVTTNGGPVLVELKEDASFTATGSLTAVNLNRVGTPPTLKAATKQNVNVTVTHGAGMVRMIKQRLNGATAGINVGSDYGTAVERVLKPGVNYVLSFTNSTSPGATVVVGYDLFLYQESAGTA